MTTHQFHADWISGNEDGALQASSKGKGKASSGSWQALGVPPPLVRALQLRGFKNPTPIQRSAIPSAMASPPRDILGMARTGSGKTLAYLVPMLHRLGGVRGSDSQGIRALILCPSRELAIQVLKAGKDLSRSLNTGADKAQSLRWSVVMGGESLEAQFEAISSNPDIVIATPGRFLHLVVEMDLDLRGVDMVIYDEADRLFEMGFELQLREILHRLPANRHSLLFSATLPSSLAEFAKAGLTNPEFIRLDTEHRISPDLNVGFFPVKPDEKDAALLVLLRDVLRIPVATNVATDCPKAIIFASTKHHVEYLSVLLQAAGYRASFIYGSLDQHARQQQLRLFRQSQTELLVVTDVAARGLDIPAMEHVINFDFPSGVRVFVHRVGRTARAGQQGYAWTLVTREEMPYLQDLELFLERPIFSNHQVYGTIPREPLESAVEFIHQSLDVSESQLVQLREVMRRGQSMFERSRSKASREAYKAIKAQTNETPPIHPAFEGKDGALTDDVQEALRESLLASIQGYNPSETIFEIGSRGQQPSAILMKQRRLAISQHRARRPASTPNAGGSTEVSAPKPTVATAGVKSYRDPNFFLPHENVETNREKGYSLKDGASFAEHARAATLDLNADEGEAQRAQKTSQLKWDRKKKRFVKGDRSTDGDQAMIRGESGALLPATFKSGKYAAWRQQTRQTSGFSRDTGSTIHAGKGRSSKGLATAEDIVKSRRAKDQRQQKNGRRPRKQV